jgi:hypothetical protein
VGWDEVRRAGAAGKVQLGAAGSATKNGRDGLLELIGQAGREEVTQEPRAAF